MVTQRKPKPSKYLTIPTRPVQVDRDRSVAGLLEKMEGTGFGGRQLAESHRIWLDMLGDNTTIMMAASGALIPAGMRRLLAYVVKNRFVDVLVLSGSVIFHDLHETLGRHHFQAHPNMTDAELESAQINRMWDLLASEEEYHEAEEWVGGLRVSWIRRGLTLRVSFFICSVASLPRSPLKTECSPRPTSLASQSFVPGSLI